MKQGKIISEVEMCCNCEVINVGYAQEYACTVGELKVMLENKRDTSLVYFKSRYDEDANIEDKSEMWIIDCAMESDEDYKLRIAKLEEDRAREEAEKQERIKQHKLQQYNNLKKELGL